MNKHVCVPVGCNHPCFCSGACMGNDSTLSTLSTPYWAYVLDSSMIDDGIVLIDNVYYRIQKSNPEKENKHE